jgi:hypothetical protein
VLDEVRSRWDTHAIGCRAQPNPKLFPEADAMFMARTVKINIPAIATATKEK